VHFVLEQALGGGVTRSLALDAHGKTLGSAILDLALDNPGIDTAGGALTIRCPRSNPRRRLHPCPTSPAAWPWPRPPLLCIGAAQAQTYPTKPIKAVVPFAAGSATDQIGRAFAAKMSATLGQTIVVENKPGVNGMLGADDPWPRRRPTATPS
jgi:hypothetical protein